MEKVNLHHLPSELQYLNSFAFAMLTPTERDAKVQELLTQFADQPKNVRTYIKIWSEASRKKAIKRILPTK